MSQHQSTSALCCRQWLYAGRGHHPRQQLQQLGEYSRPPSLPLFSIHTVSLAWLPVSDTPAVTVALAVQALLSGQLLQPLANLLLDPVERCRVTALQLLLEATPQLAGGLSSRSAYTVATVRRLLRTLVCTPHGR